MTMRTLLLALALAAVTGVLGPWLDGQPTETEAARAVANDAQAAPSDVARQQRRERAEAEMKRPRVPTAVIGVRASVPVEGSVL